MIKMRTLYFLLILATLAGTAYAEDIYAGEFNGKPAYVELESIDKMVGKTGNYVLDDDGISPTYWHAYKANVYADDVWYQVYTSTRLHKINSINILGKDKKITGTMVSPENLNLDFAWQTINENYSLATQRRLEAYKAKQAEADRIAIEKAKQQ